MKRSPTLVLTTILCAAMISSFLVAATSAQSTPELVPYPEGYREWMHVKSALITPQSRSFKRFGDLHHIYANKQ